MSSDVVGDFWGDSVLDSPESLWMLLSLTCVMHCR